MKSESYDAAYMRFQEKKGFSFVGFWQTPNHMQDENTHTDLWLYQNGQIHITNLDGWNSFIYVIILR